MDYERQRAFTLVELMIALAILVIAVSLAAPSMTQLYGKHQLDAYQAELMRLIVQARQHALINQRRVTLCALNAQGGCVSLKAGVLTSFVDGNGNRALDAGETLLQTLAIPSHVQADWVGTKPLHSLHFSGQGTTYLSNGTFTLCHQAGLNRYGKLVISRQGRVRAERHEQGCPLG